MPRAVFDPSNLSFERMPGETPKSFRAFCIYRNLGPDRTLDSVRLSLGKPQGYLIALQKWSFTYKWVERTRLYDNYIDQQSRQLSEKSLAFWEEQRQQSLANNLRTAKKMRERLEEMLDHPVTMEVQDDMRGVIEVHPAKWNYASLVALATKVAELEAATIGEAIQGTIDLDADIDSMNLEQLREYVNRTRRKGPTA